MVYGGGFTAEPLGRKGARDGLRETGNKVSLTKSLWKLGGWQKVTEGAQGRRLQVEGSDKRMW